MKNVCITCIALVLLAGCGMSDNEVKESVGTAAVKVKKGVDYTQEQMRNTYNSAYSQGRALAKTAGEKLSDAVLKAKVLTGFKLLKDLDASNVTVASKNGVVFLSGTVPTQLDRMKVEGIAYGVTGDSKKVQSTLNVKQ